ncbi:Mediator complex subunit Med20 [Penicillium alfredii]|uniref:Mediator of RNA polymerase II transcription subunit 20 n=1 Tax=Penicillium alfredii TaxID=1506179 RepID=A0A9W9KGS1_9EURO|nr:Mediator complex subunit Med20 [Penicillium alfredii]KAJ5105256.1 Mediator complex subunit Med20 [Penicillium alfredii]
MPLTGVYFIPSHPNSTTALATITERLRAAFVDDDLVPVGRWSLEQKLMRDTPGLLPASANSAQRPAKPRYMQFLSLTHYPHHGFIYASEPAEKPFHPPGAASASPAGGAPASASPPPTGPGPGTGATAVDSAAMVMTTVPPSAYGTLFQHFTYACQPFWCHRLTVAVPSGVVYDVGDFRVRLGDVRQTYPAARVRGTVVEIEWRGPSVVGSLPTNPDDAIVSEDADSGIDVSFSAIEDADIDAEYAATASLIREFWGRLGLEGAREAILVPGVGKEVKERLRRYKSQPRHPSVSGTLSDELAGVVGVSGAEDDPDPQAGADVARQFMEVLRFNR